jgi:hypothetical protein
MTSIWSYGSLLPLEQFIIQLQTGFALTLERQELQKLVGSIRSSATAEFEDDGISQSVAVQTGVTRMSKVGVKPEWVLSPFRTFPEIDAPESPFIVRIKQSEDPRTPGVFASISESDGGAWRVAAIARIGEYLRAELGDGVTILA